MNEIINAIITRRSCKNFKPDMVPTEIMDQIIEAGLFAASGKGKQAPIIIAITDKDTRDKMSSLNAKYLGTKADPFYGAPIALAVLVEKSVPTGIYDGSLVLGNMMLAAHSLGIGSCWIHRAKQSFEDEEGKEILKKLGIEGDYEGIGYCVIGYSATDNSRIIPRKENRVFRI